MKKIFLLLVPTLLFPLSSFAEVEYTNHAAKFLVEKGIITEVEDYRLGDTITRREMLKVIMNLSGKEVLDTCIGKFNDISPSDWGCKYAEAALENDFIALNVDFRPDDAVSNIEALKMVMQAQDIERLEDADWKVGYREKARDIGIIPLTNFPLSLPSKREFIFTTSAKTYTYLNGRKIIATIGVGWGGHDVYDMYAHNELLEVRGEDGLGLYPQSDNDRIFLWGHYPNQLKTLPVGTIIEAKILSDRDIEEIHCDYFDIEFGHLCESPFYRDYEILILGTNFDTIRSNNFAQVCGELTDFQDMIWYNSFFPEDGKPRYIRSNEIKIICYIEELSLIVSFNQEDIANIHPINQPGLFYAQLLFIDTKNIIPGSSYIINQFGLNSVSNRRNGDYVYDRIFSMRRGLIQFTMRDKFGDNLLFYINLFE